MFKVIFKIFKNLIFFFFGLTSRSKVTRIDNFHSLLVLTKPKEKVNT